MDKTSKKIADVFGNRLRVRVCGILLKDGKILLVKHNGIGSLGEFWAPPGGGMDFGSSAEENLKREFLEETGYKIEVEDFLCVHEHLNPPLHAIELFFKVKLTGGSLIKGTDPEMSQNEQIISEIDYKDINWIMRNRGERLHHLLNIAEKPEDLIKFEGYFFKDKIN